MLNDLSRGLAPWGLEVVGINYDDDLRDVTLTIAERLGVEYPTLKRDEVARVPF